MNREELLAQLRDIHLPESVEQANAFALASWPFAILAAIGLIVCMVRYRRRTAWRRQALASLRQISQIADADAQWSALLALALNVARARGELAAPPNAAYARPENVTCADREVLIEHIKAATAS